MGSLPSSAAPPIPTSMSTSTSTNDIMRELFPEMNFDEFDETAFNNPDVPGGIHLGVDLHAFSYEHMAFQQDWADGSIPVPNDDSLDDDIATSISRYFGDPDRLKGRSRASN